jgi:hypothetical protein
MAEKFEPKSSGGLSYLRDMGGEAWDALFGKKVPPPKVEVKVTDTKTKVDTGKGKGKESKKKAQPQPQPDINAGIVVNEQPPVPQKKAPSLEDVATAIGEALGGGRRAPPMDIDTAKAIAGMLGVNIGAAPPKPPEFESFRYPENYNIPIDVRPTANWLDQMFHTNYLAGTPSADDYQNAALKARSMITGGPAIEQARAQAKFEEYKALLDQQDLPRLLKAIAPGGLTYDMTKAAVDAAKNGTPLPASVAQGPSAPEVPYTPTAEDTTRALAATPENAGPKPKAPAAGKLPPSVVKGILEGKADAEYDNAKAIRDEQIRIQGLAPKYAEDARKDPLIKRFNDSMVPDVVSLRKLLDPRQPVIDGQRALAAIQKFQRGLIDPAAVHLGDIENIAALQSTTDQFNKMIDGYISGNKALGPEAASSILNIAGDIYDSYRQAAQGRLQSLKQQGGAQGMKPKDFERMQPNVQPEFIWFVAGPKGGPKKEYRFPYNQREKAKRTFEKNKFEYTETRH